MKHFNPRPLIVLAVLLGVVAGGRYIDAQRDKKRSVLSGFFESKPTQVASRVGGRVARISVEEGQAVKADQLLLELEAAPAREEAAAKQAAVEQARQRLRELQNGPRPEDIRRQEAVVAEARANLTRLQNGPLPEEINAARARLRQVEAQYKKAVAGLRPQEIEQARAVERSARARLDEAERGLTPEEKAQIKARLDAAVAQEALARKEAERMEFLFREGAISQQQLDRAETDVQQAEARRREQEEALRRAQAGTRAEEIEQARQAYRQAKAALDLALAGSRREDIEAAREQVAANRQALKLLLRGSRTEDIRAAEARLSQAQATLEALRTGSRKEEIAQAQAAVQAAQAAARSAQVTLAEKSIRAPQPGVVERVIVAVGDLISPGTPVIRLENPDDIWLRVYVPEAQLAKVVVGSEAQIRVDGIAEPVTAVVESVATRGEFTPANLQTPEERGKQVFAVRLRLKEPDPRIKAGMYATVTQIGTWKL